MELVFLRHATRADHASPNNPPLLDAYKPWDPSVAVSAVGEASKVARDIASVCHFAKPKRNVYVHFSPYLRCCQTADLIVSALPKEVPETKLKISMVCDFALSEWIHDRMKNAPSFIDSNEAYEMYQPNLKALENRRNVSNFRPTTTLGSWNEPGLSYRDYADRCKTYFKKLVATYEKPMHANSDDLVIIVGHGYSINHFMSFFINHPIFEEIPECTINYAKKEDGVWTLKRDCLDLLHYEDIDSTLNLENDIVIYKSNFVKKDDLDESKQYPAIGFGGLKPSNTEPCSSGRPRPSFRLEDSTNTVDKLPHAPKTFLCPTARNWNAQDSNKFQVRSEFKLKAMNDEAFKKAFDLSHPPTHPITPEISPNSEPTRTNSVIDLAKLNSNDEIMRPFKLRYSSASDIPVQYLNSKVNSHVNLASFQRGAYSNYTSSSEQGAPSVLSAGSLSPKDFSDMEAAENGSQTSSNHIGEVISSLSRIRSLQRKKALTPSFGKIRENSSDESDDSEMSKFALSFNNKDSRDGSLNRVGTGSPVAVNRNRGNSIKLISSVVPPRNGISSRTNSRESDLHHHNTYSLQSNTGSLSRSQKSSNGSSLKHLEAGFKPKSPEPEAKPKPQKTRTGAKVDRPLGPKKTPSMFYNLESDSAGSSSEGEDGDTSASSSPSNPSYTWFGQNARNYV